MQANIEYLRPHAYLKAGEFNPIRIHETRRLLGHNSLDSFSIVYGQIVYFVCALPTE